MSRMKLRNPFCRHAGRIRKAFFILLALAAMAAVSAAGELLWKAEIQRDAVDAPLEIRPEQEELVILLSSGRQAWVEYSVEVIGVFDEAPQQSLYTEEADSGFAFGDGTENP